MAITISDVADAAGVSTATVSRALRGLPHVDPATRDRVHRVAQELNYVISPTASRLASGRTGTIAVIAPFLTRWYFSTVLSGVQGVLKDSEVDLLVFEVGDDHPRGRPLGQRLRGRVDGVIIVGLPVDEAAIAQFTSLGIPVSLIGTRLPGIASVSIDDVAAGALATEHLIDAGHGRIGMITGAPDAAADTPAHDRYRGFRQALQQAGVSAVAEWEVDGHFTTAGGERAMDQLLHAAHPPTAVFAASDEMAFGAIKALRRHGLRPGHDVAVVGVDGHDLADVLDLTTVAQPVGQLGRLAAESLISQVRALAEGEPCAVAAVTLPTPLVVRGSTAPTARESARHGIGEIRP